MQNTNTNALTETNNRFASILGGDNYGKLLIALPHYLTLEERVASAAREALPSSKEQQNTILDLGCGTGLTSLVLTQVVDNACIIAIDEEPKMLTEYTKTMKHVEHEFVEKNIVLDMRQEEILHYLRGCLSGWVDAVVSVFTLHNLPIQTRAEIMKEIARVLKPEGRIVLGDKIASDNIQQHNQILLECINTFIRVYPDDTAYALGWIEHYIRDNQPDLKQTESEVYSSLAAAGFGNIRIIERYGMDAVVVADRIAK